MAEILKILLFSYGWNEMQLFFVLQILEEFILHKKVEKKIALSFIEWIKR